MKNKKYNGMTQILGLRIKFERIKRNWSQEELAERADINKSTIGFIERAINSPSIETVEKIAKAYDLTFVQLVKLAEKDIID